MSLSTSLKTHLPLMRRYARALTGSQDKGDAFVRAVLETLLADADALPQDMPVRVALYHMLSTIWSSASVEAGNAGAVPAWEVTAGQRLAALPPAARQAFLLTSVEGFNTADTALILGIDEAQVQGLLTSAMADIASQVSTRVLIIEDEPMIALEIEQIVESLGHSVTAIARTHGEALAGYMQEHPGLVLADIQLADGTSGIDAVNDMLGRTVKAPPIVFITAYPERLLTGERPEPTFLITKPFQTDMVKAIISQALFFEGVPEAVA